MTTIRIKGKRKLSGEVLLQGSKNAVLPMLAASVLLKGITVINNCPDISDVHEMLSQLTAAGARVRLSGNVLTIDSQGISPQLPCKRELAKTRGSVLFLGALLGRFSEACISYPGGCVIGKRPIDLHLSMLRKMGITLKEQEDAICAQGTPAGAELFLKLPSVGATENVILAAVCARGTTILHGAAAEPEITELCEFLNAAGARISGMGTRTLRLEGVPVLHGVEHTVSGDRIVAGTLLCAAAMTGGNVTISGAERVCLTGFDRVLLRSGVLFEQKEDRIRAVGTGTILPSPLLVTGPFPDFPTDMQSLLLAVLTLARGESRICETLFESRFKIVPELLRMGAEIETEGNLAVLHGVSGLIGTRVTARELRGGAALMLAGLAAEGETTLYGFENIARGYEDFCEKLRSLGAEIVQ